MHQFIGYIRPDGSVGIRNHVALLGFGLTGAAVCRMVAGLVKNALPVFCSSEGSSSCLRIAKHPNIAGFVVVQERGNAPADDFRDELERTGKPHEVFELQQGDFLESMLKIAQVVSNIIQEASTQRREVVNFPRLVLGFFCHDSREIHDILDHFLCLVEQERARCLWLEEAGRDERELYPGFLERKIGDIKFGQPLGKRPGVYRYMYPGSEDNALDAVIAFGAQLLLFPAERKRALLYPIVPILRFAVDREINAASSCELYLSRLRTGEITAKDAGLLLFSEVLATASGKLTNTEMFGDILFIQ
ncbi:MAG: UxaA family hydrolase [Dehalococcoidales bacterium]